LRGLRLLEVSKIISELLPAYKNHGVKVVLKWAPNIDTRIDDIYINSDGMVEMAVSSDNAIVNTSDRLHYRSIEVELDDLKDEITMAINRISERLIGD
jgi:hypothetical protein